ALVQSREAFLEAARVLEPAPPPAAKQPPIASVPAPAAKQPLLDPAPTPAPAAQAEEVGHSTDIEKVASSPAELDTENEVVLVLEVRSDGRIEEREITGETIIGRTDPNRGISPDLSFPNDTLISRRHLRISPKDECYVLTDLASTNGTRLNGIRLRPNAETALRAGDTIEIGEVTFLRVLRAPMPRRAGAERS
ncbi:MAG: FHA domain-containing protein, partial [Armatimonadetes bacterium]|nr:FHA domain-containing protein [Armatimonadota bacterium]